MRIAAHESSITIPSAFVTALPIVAPRYFCNYACLSAYIDENELTYGDACEWSPES